MEIILREHVDNLGRRGEIVKVADGYARNYLLPQKLALPVTDNNRRQIERERKRAETHEAEERQAAQTLADRLSGVECVMTRKVGEHDVLYGSVTAADIAEALAAQHVHVDKRKIQLAEPIRDIGDVVVSIKVHRDVTAQMTVRVVKEDADA